MDAKTAAREFATVGRRLILATHRRSGTHLTIDLLRKQFAEFQSRKRLGEPLHRLYFTLELLNSRGLTGRRLRTGALSEQQALAIMRRPARPIVKTHALPGFDAWRPQFAAFVDEMLREADIYYIHRDGRDVLASLHTYMQFFHPEARCPLGQFIRQEIDGVNHVQAWADHVRAWIDQPAVRVLRFEDIVQDTAAVLKRIGSELGLKPRMVEPLLPRRLRNIWESRLLRFVSTCPEPSTILSDGYNRRTKVDWRTALSRDDRAFVHEQAGDVLVRLGYESSDGWITRDVPDDRRDRSGSAGRSARDQ